jgi:hypothetical protein
MAARWRLLSWPYCAVVAAMRCWPSRSSACAPSSAMRALASEIAACAPRLPFWMLACVLAPKADVMPPATCE